MPPIDLIQYLNYDRTISITPQKIKVFYDIKAPDEDHIRLFIASVIILSGVGLALSQKTGKLSLSGR